MSTETAERGQLLVVGAAVVFAATLVGWFLLSGPGTTNEATTGAAIVSQSQLVGLARSVDHPVYWVGPKSGYSYEVTTTHDGRFYVRYLPRGVAAGDPRATFLTVGTYSRTRAFADLRHAAKIKGPWRFELGRHELVVFAPKFAKSAYFGFRGAKYQVEVYDPSGKAASRLVLAGRIVPVS